MIDSHGIMDTLLGHLGQISNEINSSLQSLQQWLASHPTMVINFAVSCSLFGWFVSLTFGKLTRPWFAKKILSRTEKPAASSKFKQPARAPGVWTPQDFKRPAAPPYPDWDIHATKPLPYRPFRHGPYHITMGLRTMKWDEWIELDNHFPKFHADKDRRIKERGSKCCKTAPEAFDGACELLEEL